MYSEEQITKMRKCTCCEENKPLTEEYFYKEKTAKDGFRAKCKECMKSKYKHYQDETFNIYIWYQNKSEKFKNNWNFEDIKWIYDNYNNINKQTLINKFPNFNYKTIHNLISQWNIRKLEKNNDWSDEDIIYLINNYPNIPQEQIQNYFNYRTWDAIKNKASKLNIKRDDQTLFLIRSESHKGFIVSEETKRKQSRIRRGANNYNWKGGLSALHPYFRSTLYEWKMDSLKTYNYKCALTGINDGNLEIHHINENFSDIIMETLNLLRLPLYQDMLQYSDEDMININKTFLDLNYNYGLGIPLRRFIHRLFHSIYGRENNDKEQFEEFIQRYKLGEFNNQLTLMEENSKIKLNNYHPSNGKKFKKLIKDDVIKIKNLILKNMPDRYIANIFKISETAVYNIRTNRTWVGVNIEENI